MFEVGDRVVCLTDYDGVPIQGREATVVCVYGRVTLALEFDERVGPHTGHGCAGLVKHGYGWNVPAEEVEPVTRDTRSLVERKCRKLWNNSNWIKAHPNLAY